MKPWSDSWEETPRVVKVFELRFNVSPSFSPASSGKMVGWWVFLRGFKVAWWLKKLDLGEASKEYVIFFQAIWESCMSLLF